VEYAKPQSPAPIAQRPPNLLKNESLFTASSIFAPALRLVQPLAAIPTRDLRAVGATARLEAGIPATSRNQEVGVRNEAWEGDDLSPVSLPASRNR
jgi:hypothetical protein